MFEAVAWLPSWRRRKKERSAGTVSSSTKDKKRFIRKFDVAPHMGYMTAVIQQDPFYFFLPSLSCMWGWGHVQLSQHPWEHVSHLSQGGGRDDGIDLPQVCGRWPCVSYDKQPVFASYADFFFFPFFFFLWSGKYWNARKKFNKFRPRLRVCDLAPSVTNLRRVVLRGETWIHRSALPRNTPPSRPETDVSVQDGAFCRNSVAFLRAVQVSNTDILLGKSRGILKTLGTAGNSHSGQLLTSPHQRIHA